MSDVGRLVRERGLVVLSQVTATEFLDTMPQLGPPYTHPDGEADGTTLITPSERPGQPGRGFTMEALPVHTDRSSLVDPPRFLGMRLVRHHAHRPGGRGPVSGPRVAPGASSDTLSPCPTS